MGNIIENYKYAPGIATYGIKGQRGDVGKPGYSLYFIPYDDGINDNVKNSIKNNTFITNNPEFNGELLLMKNRKYQINDLFLTIDGKIHRLKDIENVTFEHVMDLYDSSTLIYSSGKLTNYNGKPLILSSGITSLDDINKESISLLNVYNNDNNNYISFINDSNNNLIIKNSDNGFLFDTSNKIYVNNLYTLDDTESKESITINNNTYYKPITIKNDISIDEIYTLNDNGELQLKDNCEYRYIKKDTDSNEMIICYHNKEDESISYDKNDYKLFEIYYHVNEYITKFIKIV